jgi:murein DD-endopeptidase MepM/ murein hydrolase activator NlpD
LNVRAAPGAQFSQQQSQAEALDAIGRSAQIFEDNPLEQATARYQPGDSSFLDRLGRWRQPTLGDFNPVSGLVSPQSALGPRAAGVGGGRRTARFPQQGQPTGVQEEAEGAPALQTEEDYGALDYAGELIDQYLYLSEQRDAALQQGLSMVAAGYDQEIARIGDQIRKAKAGGLDVDAAYAKYVEKTEQGFAVAASYLGDIEESKATLQASQDAAEAGVDAAYNTAMEGVNDILKGAESQPLARQIEADVLEMQEIFETAVEDQSVTAEEMLIAADAMGDAVLASGLADMQLDSEAARQTVKLEIQGHVQKLLDEKARLQDEKALAVERARQEFETNNPLELPDPESAWGYSFSRWMEDKGWTFEEQADFAADYQRLYDAGARTREDAHGLIRGIVFDENLAILEEQGFNYQSLTETLALAEDGDAMLKRFNDWLENPRGVSNMITMVPGLREYNFDKLVTPGEYGDLLNVFGMREQFVAEWDAPGGIKQGIEQATMSINPTNGWVFPIIGGADFSNSFGYQKPESKGGHKHMGVDLYSPSGRGGELIAAPVSGVVESLGNGSGDGGYYVKLRGDDGYIYYFAHNQNRHPVRQGQRVSAGQLIGYVGDSGNARGSKPHVHFEIRDGKGNRVNPYAVLQGAR